MVRGNGSDDDHAFTHANPYSVRMAQDRHIESLRAELQEHRETSRARAESQSAAAKELQRQLNTTHARILAIEVLAENNHKAVMRALKALAPQKRGK
jgi:hypothetical protein